jgi:hypothetical protein
MAHAPSLHRPGSAMRRNRSMNLVAKAHADEPSASLERDAAGKRAAKRVRHANLLPVAERGGFGWGDGQARRVVGALPFTAFFRGSGCVPPASPARGFPGTAAWAAPPRTGRNPRRRAAWFPQAELADAIAG